MADRPRFCTIGTDCCSGQPRRWGDNTSIRGLSQDQYCVENRLNRNGTFWRANLCPDPLPCFSRVDFQGGNRWFVSDILTQKGARVFSPSPPDGRSGRCRRTCSWTRRIGSVAGWLDAQRANIAGHPSSEPRCRAGPFQNRGRPRADGPLARSPRAMDKPMVRGLRSRTIRSNQVDGG